MIWSIQTKTVARTLPGRRPPTPGAAFQRFVARQGRNVAQLRRQRMILKFDVQAPMSLRTLQLVEYMRHAEEMDFDGVGLADHMEFGRDVYAVLAMAAQRTHRIQLFPCVSNPVTRHPWVLAN